jgi:hypothetical protein
MGGRVYAAQMGEMRNPHEILNRNREKRKTT